MSRSVRLYAIIAAALVVVLGIGTIVAIQLVKDEVNESIPQADLFGSQTPTPPAPTATPSPTPPPGADIKGPLNILIVGVDTRTWVKNWIPHADAVMIMHVNADLTKAYLTSLPRDLVVNIPAFKPAGFGGARTKLTHAMSYGAKVPGKAAPSTAQGFQLVARTVEAYTGIKRFDAGLVLTFQGLSTLVDAVGGIDLYIDSKIVSIHMAPNGKHRPGCSGCEHGYGGPAATYNVGMRHIVGWQALDISRQRYLAGADYTRQRHQRQIIKAIIAKLAKTDIMTNATTLAGMLKSLNSKLIFDGRGRQPTEWAYALRKLGPGGITLVGIPGSGAYSGGSYIGENLNGVQSSFFAALRDDKLDSYLKSHQNLINPDKQS